MAEDKEDLKNHKTYEVAFWDSETYRFDSTNECFNVATGFLQGLKRSDKSIREITKRTNALLSEYNFSLEQQTRLRLLLVNLNFHGRQNLQALTIANEILSTMIGAIRSIDIETCMFPRQYDFQANAL